MTHIKTHGAAGGEEGKGRRRSAARQAHEQAGIVLMPGKTVDFALAPALLATVVPPRRLLGDKAYDIDAFPALLAELQIEAMIPSSMCGKWPDLINREAKRRRNLIERMFCRLED